MTASVAPRPAVPSDLRAAGFGASALVVLALIIEVQAPADDHDPWPRVTSILIQLAALCVVGLTARRAPSIAWIAAILAAGLAVIEAIGALRAAELGGNGSPWFVPIASLDRLATAAIALAYGISRAARSGRHGLTRSEATLALAAVGLVLVEAAALAMAVTAGATIDSWPQRVANRSLLAFVVLAAAVGAVLDLRGPLQTARRQFDEPITVRRLPAFLGVLADELLPFRRTARRDAAELERARLAADLHAEVLPELRSALATARAPEIPLAMGQRLEHAVDQIEELMEARRSVVLESLGLLAALEWLAERTEARSSITVHLEIADGDADSLRPPIPVERAAFRVAQLALDNVVRHARATTATLSLRADARRLELRIVDDGVGFATNAGMPGRGLADMRAEADAARAGLTVASGSGTTIEFRWPS